MKYWKTIKSKIAYDCKYFKIIEEDFVVPCGKKHKWHVLDTNDYVVVIARENNYFYLIEQYRYTTRSRLLQVVAGAIEKNDTPLQSAKKELKEEAGIKAKKFKKLGWYYAFYGCSNQKAYVYLAEELEIGEQAPDYFERECGIKRRKLKISEIENMIKSGKIQDHDTLSALCLFMLKFNNK